MRVKIPGIFRKIKNALELTGMMTLSKPESLDRLLEKFFRQHGQEQRFKELKVFDAWNEAVGEQISRNAQPVSVNQGRLVVSVRNSIWLQELGFSRQKLKNKLNRILGKGVIKDISFRIGQIADAESVEKISQAPSKPLSPELEQKINNLLISIEDPELRAELKSLILVISQK